MPGEIVVKRIEGAAVQEPFLIGVLKIGVVGRSRGRNTETSFGCIRKSTIETMDDFPVQDNSAIDTKIRGVLYAKNLVNGHTDEVFVPGLHFNVYALVGGNYILLDPKNFGDYENASSLKIDWSKSPRLQAPPILTLNEISGNLNAGTYTVAITAFDQRSSGENYYETTLSPTKEITLSGTGKGIRVSWRKVEYAKGYRVWIKSDETWYVAATIQDKYTTTADIQSLGSQTTPPLVNNSRQVPPPSTGTTPTYQLFYFYGKIETNVVKEFTSFQQVLDEHGMGSELTNIARIYMNPEFNNAPVLCTVVPEGETLNDYIEAVSKFSQHHVQFIVVLYAGSEDVMDYIENVKPIYDLAVSLSHEETGQKECYAIFALPGKQNRDKRDIITFCSAFQATGTKGKRGILVVPDGFNVKFASWLNTDGTYTSRYTLLDPAGIDITPIAFAGACFARYIGMRDIAEPLTEKDTAGFIFTEMPFTTTEIGQFIEAGAMVVRNDNRIPITHRFINMSLPVLSLEDAEMNIAIVEDWMKNDLRRVLRKYRGRKMIGAVLHAAQRTLIQKLEQYVNESIIAYFDANSVTVRQDETQKDRLIGFFKYMPIYPINRIKILYDFTFVVL